MTYEDRVKEMRWREARDKKLLWNLKRNALAKRATQKKVTPFSDLPVVLNKDFALYEDYDQMIHDSLEGLLPNSQTAKVGQYWVEYKSRAKGVVIKTPKKESFYHSFSHTTERVTSPVEEREKEIIIDAYRIWRIELPTHLFPLMIQCPVCDQVFTMDDYRKSYYKKYPEHWKSVHEQTLGQTPLKLKCLWKSERWNPEVFKGIWKDASDFECENWSRIPVNLKRINFCIGLIRDDTSDE